MIRYLCAIIRTFSIIMMISLSGCSSLIDLFLPPNPDEFQWRSSFWLRCNGVKLSSLQSVNLTSENGYILEHTSSAGFMAQRITDYRVMMNIKLLSGTGIRIRTRTTIEEAAQKQGILLDYTDKGIEIKDGDRLIAKTDTITNIDSLPKPEGTQFLNQLNGTALWDSSQSLNWRKDPRCAAKSAVTFSRPSR